jgi:hypothetical protein
MKKMKVLVLALASLVGPYRGKTFGLANEAAATTRGAQHWKRKTALAIGRPDLAEGADDDLDAAHDKHMQLMNEEEEMPPGPETVSGAENTVHKTEAEIAADEKAGKDLALANEQLAARINENIELQLANAITSGKITPAEKPVWLGKFANDYDGTKDELSKAPVKVKTTPKTAGLGAPSVEAVANEQERQEAVLGLVNEVMERDSLTYTPAFNKVKADSKNKHLFDAMKKPEATKK